MNVIRYVRHRGNLECAEIKRDEESKETELRFEDKLVGSIKLGSLAKKIDGESCFFDTGLLENGIYQPTIYLQGYIVTPEAFEISDGTPRLIPKSDEYIRNLSGELERLFGEISKIKEQLSEFDGKINGHPIF